MKILTLRLKNLNSLYGEWFIDFSHPEYSVDGIFALTGPTGAGKSTILDAICLALYGQTPRLGKITQSGNEIMSRHTGECYAEVLFESQEGRFLCRWGQHRARRKADGRLADASHEISDASNITNLYQGSEDEAQLAPLIENKKSLVPGIVEEKTAMDFERFTRSILLAQGSFDTFLKADSEQKSRILEQITGTDIYSTISERTHERQRAEQEKLQLLLAEISGIHLLEPEQEHDIQTELKAKQKQETELQQHTQQTSTAIQWLEGIAKLKSELQSLATANEKLQADIITFHPQQQQLTEATKAAELDGRYAILTNLRKQQADNQSDLTSETGKLPKLEQHCSQQTQALEKAGQQLIHAKETLKQASPLIQQVRLLDQQLFKQQQDVLKAEKNQHSILKDIQAHQQTKQTRQQQQQALSTQSTQLQNYLQEHAQDQWLVSGFSGLTVQFNHLLKSQKAIKQHQNSEKKAHNAVKTAEKSLQQANKKQLECEQSFTYTQNALSKAQTAFDNLLAGRLLREYRAEQESLQREKLLRARIAQLEEHRTQLEDGKACPLCGAKEHPFAHGNIPAMDEIDKKLAALSQLLKTAEEQQEQIKQLESNAHTAQQKLQETQAKIDLAKVEKQNAERKLLEQNEQFKKTQQDFAELQSSLLNTLPALGITNLADTEINTLLQSLQERLNNWQNKQQQQNQLEQQINTLSSELKHLDGILETQQLNLDQANHALKDIQRHYQEENSKRQTLYANKDPDQEEKQLRQAIIGAEQMEKSVQVKHTQAQQQLNHSLSHIETLQKRIEQNTAELNTKETAFIQALTETGFKNETQFLAACLQPQEREKIATQAKALNDQKIRIQTQQQDRTQRLKTETAKNLSNQALGTLQSQFTSLTITQQQLKDTIAALKHQLNENKRAKERIQNQQQAIDIQKKEHQRWEKLHKLIGSADGKKYRNFAQGLTFEIMVAQANQQLSKMTDRYLLSRDHEQPLELNVIDNYQAGEIRSTRNLSGGESFIISLALALGLSQMASRKVRVDSLFLDEGFGTLDEDALETALETLSALQHDGKLIGVISHVASVKERIATQINVRPVSGGRSVLSGPGCCALAVKNPKLKTPAKKRPKKQVS